jgi:hypothetical protein
MQKLLEKCLHGAQRRRWEESIKTHLKEICFDDDILIEWLRIIFSDGIWYINALPTVVLTICNGKQANMEKKFAEH